MYSKKYDIYVLTDYDDGDENMLNPPFFHKAEIETLISLFAAGRRVVLPERIVGWQPPLSPSICLLRRKNKTTKSPFFQCGDLFES